MAKFRITLQADCINCSDSARQSIDGLLDQLRDAIEQAVLHVAQEESGCVHFEKRITDHGDSLTSITQPFLVRADFDHLEGRFNALDTQLTRGHEIEATLTLQELREWLKSKRSGLEGEA